MLTYDTLEVHIGRDGGRGFAVVARSPTGSAEGVFALPCSEESLARFPPRLDGGGAEGAGGFETVEAHEARRFGTALFDALFAEEVAELYREARRQADRQDRALRITLAMDGTPELAAVPWEYLCDQPEFLALSAWTPVVRRIELGSRRPPARITQPLRILGMISSPPDQAPLDAGRERDCLERALADLVGEGLVELRWCDAATLSDLHEHLEDADIHVFHYVGHGAYHPAAGDGVLYLEGDGAGEPVAAQRLGAILGEEHDLRLTVLNACEGARSSRDDPFAGVAAGLVRRGLPAVVGMQSAITMDAARLFSEHFYRALARGHGVDAAVAKGRLGVYASGNEVEWAVPVLFLQVPDGRIFDLRRAEPAPAREQPAPLDQILASLYDALPERRAREPVAGGLELPSLPGLELAAVRRETGAATPTATEFCAAVSRDGEDRAVLIGQVADMGDEQAGVIAAAEAAARSSAGADVLDAVNRAITLAAPPEGRWVTLCAQLHPGAAPAVTLSSQGSPRAPWSTPLLVWPDGQALHRMATGEPLPLSGGDALVLCFRAQLPFRDGRPAGAAADELADFIAAATSDGANDDREAQCVVAVRAAEAAGPRMSVEIADDVAVLHAEGEIDLYTVSDLKGRLVDAFESNPRCLVLDFAEVTFFDSAGLGILSSAANRARRNGTQLRLVVAHPSILYTLTLTGYDLVFDVHRTLESALRSLPASGPV